MTIPQQPPYDPLDDPRHVYEHAESIKPEILLGRPIKVFLAYAKRLGQDFGKPGLGPAEQNMLEDVFKATLAREQSLPDAANVYANAGELSPESLRGQPCAWILAYLRRIIDDWGQQGFGREEKDRLLQILEDEENRGLTPEEIQRSKERDQELLREIKEEADRQENLEG